MATRVKTIEYAFPVYTSLVADATLTPLDQITLYIPESSPTFISATVEVGFEDVITATGGTITEHRVQFQLGAASSQTFTETDDITHSGENLSGVIGPIDETSYFTTNWSGTSMTCDISVYFDQNTGTTLGTRNITATVTITYQYDDDPATNATQIKTVYIPFESLTGALSTSSNSEIGTNQIPQLTSGGILPEASVVIRDYYFLIEGSTSENNSNTDFTVSVNIDSSGSPFSFGTHEAALATDSFSRLIWKVTSPPSTTSAHAFQMWSSTARYNLVTITLIVTYEFDATSTTSVLNSIILPIEMSSPLGVATSAEASRFARDIFIEEPGTISMKQSAFRINWNVGAAISGINWRAGNQSFRTYTHVATGVGGMFSLQQRIDSDSSQGSGFSLARGKNSITIDGYTTDTTDQMTNINGYLVLNYTSGIGSGGLGQNAHTVKQLLLAWDALLTDRNRISNYSVTIPESNYWIVGSGFIFIQWVSSVGQAITFDVEVLSGEAKGAGYLDIYADAYQTDSERANTIVYMRGRDVFKRYPSDPDTQRLDIETSRDYRLFTTTTTSNGLLAMITYHSHTFSIAGTVSGYTGDGSGLTINIYRSDTKELIGSTTTASGGGYSFTWYDDTIDLYAECLQDSTHMGRSDNGTAT